MIHCLSLFINQVNSIYPHWPFQQPVTCFFLVKFIVSDTLRSKNVHLRCAIRIFGFPLVKLTRMILSLKFYVLWNYFQWYWSAWSIWAISCFSTSFHMLILNADLDLHCLHITENDIYTLFVWNIKDIMVLTGPHLWFMVSKPWV